MSDFEIPADLQLLVETKSNAGELLTAAQMAQHLGAFTAKFGPQVLAGLDGEALLKLMHGRLKDEPPCLVHWLEFKNDDEFPARYGGIGGGAATKFGVYQRHADGAWATGGPTTTKVIDTAEAVAIARRQRDQLLAGVQVLQSIPPGDSSDATYANVQKEMQSAAPELYRSGWAHKYWFLCAPDRLDDFHSSRWQRFHLFKLLQMPPDRIGVLEGDAPRFVCAGRFVGLAKALGVPVPALTEALNLRSGSLHRYWRVGTRDGENTPLWDEMRSNGVASIGWNDIGDISAILSEQDPKGRIRDLLLPSYPGNPAVATRKAGEVRNFSLDMAEGDLVVACDGMSVLGVGRVTGAYTYRRDLKFAHVRPVEWLAIEPWTFAEQEGLRTTCVELGRSATNLLDIERHIAGVPALPVRPQRAPILPPPATSDDPLPSVPLPPLDPLAARVEAALHRRGQVILHGPPGTGKTYSALRIARELAARRRFGTPFAGLDDTRRREIDGAGAGDGLVRVCSFHPGYGYEDFVEGLRPGIGTTGALIFTARPGVFRRLCGDAAAAPDRSFFLVIDEINRGDVPRIFGELMTVLELDKRDQKVLLPLTGDALLVPPNLFLIATMNTADRSIALLDAALRRRFAFIELMPDDGLLAHLTVGQLGLSEWLAALNARLRSQLPHDGRNRQVGHAYLLTKPPVTSAAAFARILRDEIVPLIQEYCADDFAALETILGAELIDRTSLTLRHELFEPGREADLIDAVMRGLELSGTAAMDEADEPPDENSAA